MKVIVMTDDQSIRRVEDAEADELVQAGRAEIMTREQLRDFEIQSYNPFKKLYGTVKTDTFGAFCHKAFGEGIVDENGRTDIGKAVELLAERYVSDDTLLLNQKKTKKKDKAEGGADYLGDHK